MGALSSALFAKPLTIGAAYLPAAVILLMAFVRQKQLLLVVATLAGVAWTCTANELWVAGQRAMPVWARGRMNATVLMFSQGAMALGGVMYGATAQTFGVRAVLVVVALLIVLLLLIFQFVPFSLSIDFTRGLTCEPGALTPLSQHFIQVPQPRDGPVLVTVDLQLDQKRECEYGNFMEELRLIHLRNGACSWQLFRDPAQADHFHVEIMMPSWSGYLAQFERITKAEKQVIDRALSLQLGQHPLETRVYIRINKRLPKGS